MLRGVAVGWICLGMGATACADLCADYLAILKQNEKDWADGMKAVAAAKTPAEKVAAKRQLPKVGDCARRLTELARAAPQDPAVLDIARWILSKQLGRAETEPILEVVTSGQAENPGIKDLIPDLTKLPYPAVESLFRKTREQSPDREVRGRATLALAVWRSHFRVSDPELAALFREVIDQYGDLPEPAPGKGTLGSLARARRAQAGIGDTPDEPVVGQLAPEIRGTDLDGKPMALSEFCGKVVLLDFWGDW